MFPLIRMTPEQIDSYRPIWGAFTRIGYTFPGHHSRTNLRTFAFYGSLDVREDGFIGLHDLMVACSGEDQAGEQVEAIRSLQAKIAQGEWRILGSTASHLEGVREEFQLRLLTEESRDARCATHLMLSYEDTDQDQADYLHRCFPVEQGGTRTPGPPMGHFYPVGMRYAPEKAESLTVPQLARRLRGRPIVAFTGAGISLSSGLPTFRGPESLERYFPLHERFPGAVTGWMIERPRDLAQVLGHFQACFITAQPNAAHGALAELEKEGIVIHLITGNADRLHERAGSRQVHLKDERDFGEAGRGWHWIQEGRVFLVVGISRDEHGLLSYARDQGLQVVVIAPERPSFLYRQDWFVPGRAEDVLPDFAARLLTGRRCAAR